MILCWTQIMYKYFPAELQAIEKSVPFLHCVKEQGLLCKQAQLRAQSHRKTVPNVNAK